MKKMKNLMVCCGVKNKVAMVIMDLQENTELNNFDENEENEELFLTDPCERKHFWFMDLQEKTEIKIRFKMKK